MGLLFSAQCALLPDPAVPNQRAARSHEAERRPHDRRRGIRHKTTVPDAWLLLHYWPTTSPLFARRLQSCIENTWWHWAQQKSHVRSCHGRPLHHLLLRRIQLHDDAPVRRRHPHVQPYPRLRLSYQEFPEKRSIRQHHEEKWPNVRPCCHLRSLQPHQTRRHNPYSPPG